MLTTDYNLFKSLLGPGDRVLTTDLHSGLHLFKSLLGPGDWVLTTDLHSGLHQVQLEGQRLAHEDVGVVRVLEGGLQLLQLPAREVGPRPAPLPAPLFAAVASALVAWNTAWTVSEPIPINTAWTVDSGQSMNHYT